MCVVPSIAVFCSESIEFFHGMVSKFFFKPSVTIPVSLVITSIITHFMLYIGCISVHQLLYFSCFFVGVGITFLSTGIATFISMHVFSFLFLIIICGLFAVTFLSVCPLIP